jgi:hypothetical protein
VGSHDKNIYAIDKAGVLKWKFNTSGEVKSSPALGPDGTLYVGSSDKNIYAIDKAGVLKWKFNTSGEVKSSPALGPDGTLYVGSGDYNIYAIDTGINCSCPAGTFLNSTALFTSCSALEAVCSPCPIGSYCPRLRSAVTSPVPCPAGCFCNSTRMAAPNPCPAGSYSPVVGAVSEKMCKKCTGTSSCFPNGQAAEITCPLGNYCPNLFEGPKPCPAGTYNSILASNKLYDCKPCTLGHYCPLGSVAPKPCELGSYSDSTGLSECKLCPADSFGPTVGAAACTPCGPKLTSKSNSSRCEPCFPSPWYPDKFKCYTDFEKAAVILGLIVSITSSLFSVYKFRIFVRKRVEKLKEAGIKPSLRRVVFLDRTLANHAKLMLLRVFEKEGSTDGHGLTSDGGVAQSVRDMHRQLLQMQEQLQQHEQQFELKLLQQQLEIRQLRQQLLL